MKSLISELCENRDEILHTPDDFWELILERDAIIKRIGNATAERDEIIKELVSYFNPNWAVMPEWIAMIMECNTPSHLTDVIKAAISFRAADAKEAGDGTNPV